MMLAATSRGLAMSSSMPVYISNSTVCMLHMVAIAGVMKSLGLTLISCVHHALACSVDCGFCIYYSTATVIFVASRNTSL